MNDFDLCERTHIEGVIEKAEKGAFPFVIKVTNADTLKEDSMDTADEEKFDSTVNQTTSNTNEPEELIDGKSKILLETPTGSTSLSEELDKQQNEEILGELVPEISVVKFEQESSLDAEANLQKSTRSEEVRCDISDAEMKHIRKVAEAAMMMEADIQRINSLSSDHKIVSNLQNMAAVNSLIESEIAEELNTSESPDMDWKSESNRKDVLITTVFSAERVEPEQILNAKEMICETCKETLGNSETSEANSISNINSLQKVPNLKSLVIKTNFDENFSKAKSNTTDMEGTKIFQNYERLEKKLSEEEVMHIEELEERINQPERLENFISREMMETKTVNLTEELAQISLVNEQAKQLEKLDEFDIFALEDTEKYKYQETQQDICVVGEKFGQTRVATEQIKELEAVDGSFLRESKIDKQKEEKDECLTKYNLLQANTFEEQAKEMESFATLRVEETAIVENLSENKDISLPGNTFICIVQGKAKNLEENGSFKQKEAETMQEQNKGNNTLTEEELMQIRAVEQRAKQMEEFSIFGEQSAKVLEEIKDSDLITNRLATTEKPQHRLTAEELEHIKEVERNAVWQLEMPLLERFSSKNDTATAVNQVELQQKGVALGEVAFNKVASMLNPLKNSVITTLSFKSNVDEAKLFQSTSSAEDVSKASKQIAEESTKAHPENQNFEIDIPTVNEINHIYNTEVLVTTKDLSSVQTATEYPENQDSEYRSSSESSNFGPGTSDEDEETDQNSVKSSDLFSEAIFSTPEFKDDIGFPKVKEPSTKYDISKNTNLSLEVTPSPIHTELLPNSRTEVFGSQSKQILDMTSSPSFTNATQAFVQLDDKDSTTDGGTVDRFAGLTEKEIEHIKMVDLQFELENAEDVSKISMHKDEDSEVENDANFVSEVIADAEEYEPQEDELAVDVRGSEALSFINVDDKVRSNTHIGIESIESEKDVVHDISQTPLKNKLLEQSIEGDLTADQRSKSWQSAHERDDKMKSLEELGREINIGKWYEERLSSLRNSLCAEETAEISGFNLNLYNLMIITLKKILFCFTEI